MKTERPWDSVGLLLEAARPERGPLLRGGLWLLVAAALEVLAPILGKRYIDHHLLPGRYDLGEMATLLALMLLTRWAALATGLLMAAFVVGIASVWARGYSIAQNTGSIPSFIATLPATVRHFLREIGPAGMKIAGVEGHPVPFRLLLHFATLVLPLVGRGDA